MSDSLVGFIPRGSCAVLLSFPDVIAISVLKDIIDERKRLFADNNCSTFVDFHTISKMPLPAVLVLIDNFASFRDKYMDIADSFIELISSGSTVGVYFIITGSTKNSIYYKVTEQISTYFTLRMNDPSNYLDISLPTFG